MAVVNLNAPLTQCQTAGRSKSWWAAKHGAWRVGPQRTQNLDVTMETFDIEFIRLAADHLQWAIRLYRGLKDNEPHGSFFLQVVDAKVDLHNTMVSLSPTPRGEFYQQAENLRRATRWLGMLGFDSSNTELPQYAYPEIPQEVLELLDPAITYFEHLATNRAIAESSRQEAELAQRSGVFIEYVERNPGKGSLRSIGPFQSNAAYGGFVDEGPVSWTLTTVFEYPNRRWVVMEEDHHREVGFLESSVAEVSEAEAARIVLGSDLELNVETLVWAKNEASALEQAASAPEDSQRPVWNASAGTLNLANQVVRHVSPRAHQVRKLLNCFEESEWERRIDSPWTDDEQGKTTLRETIRSLNKGCRGLRFGADGLGQGATWELTHMEDPEIPF